MCRSEVAPSSLMNSAMPTLGIQGDDPLWGNKVEVFEHKCMSFDILTKSTTCCADGYWVLVQQLTRITDSTTLYQPRYAPNATNVSSSRRSFWVEMVCASEISGIADP
jgi:hypothetical protein